LRILERAGKAILPWRAMSFHRSGGRSRDGKWPMGGIRGVGEDKGRGPLLSRLGHGAGAVGGLAPNTREIPRAA
jgi:hypothetical protein